MGIRLLSKKKIAAFASVAVFFSFVMLHGIPGFHIDVYSIMSPFDEDTLVEKADLIVVGTVLSDKLVASPSDTFPGVQITTLGSLGVLKDIASVQGGRTLGDSNTVEVRAMGDGAVVKNGLRYEMSSIETPDYKVGERVMLFLEYEKGHELGDGYYSLNGAAGKYVVYGNMAMSPDASMHTRVSDIQQKIRDLQ